MSMKARDTPNCDHFTHSQFPTGLSTCELMCLYSVLVASLPHFLVDPLPLLGVATLIHIATVAVHSTPIKVVAHVDDLRIKLESIESIGQLPKGNQHN